MQSYPCRTVFSFVALVTAPLLVPITGAETLYQLPDPDGKPADQSKPVQVFILMGQSNMLGFGRVAPEDKPGTLAYLTRKEGRYPHLIDDQGNWTVRNDVHYVQTTVGNRQHPLTVMGRHIGVELQFGHIMGHIHDEPVLILKACIGNRSLGWDLLAKEAIGRKKSVKVLQDDFLRLKFGLFVHFNMATYKGVQWVSGYLDPSTFNSGGDAIDTDAWADATVSAGMRYSVLTAEHVSAFCLWGSKYTIYDVMHPDRPYQKDLVTQFIESFKGPGLKVGLYYGWRHPGFGDPNRFKVLPPECDPATHALEQQHGFQKAPIADPLTKYPDVFYIGNDARDPEVMVADRISAHLRGVRPQILASANWWNWAKKGTPYVDLSIKALRPSAETNEAPGETCWCLEQKWSWSKEMS